MSYTREQIEHYIGSVETLARVCTEITVDTGGVEMLRQLLAENDELREDAERWRMSVIIARETLQPPSVRKHQTEINAYINAIAGGFDLTYAIDAARKNG